MTWQGIFVKRTTRRGALETRGLWEKQPWAHSLGPFPPGPAALTESSPAPSRVRRVRVPAEPPPTFSPRGALRARHPGRPPCHNAFTT